MDLTSSFGFCIVICTHKRVKVEEEEGRIAGTM